MYVEVFFFLWLGLFSMMGLFSLMGADWWSLHKWKWRIVCHRSCVGWWEKHPWGEVRHNISGIPSLTQSVLDREPHSFFLLFQSCYSYDPSIHGPDHRALAPVSVCCGMRASSTLTFVQHCVLSPRSGFFSQFSLPFPSPGSELQTGLSQMQVKGHQPLLSRWYCTS